MPSSGLSPWANAAGPPEAPLASAYESTAVMKACPTSGPRRTRSTSHAQDAASSRRSLSSRRRQGASLGEGKEDLLDVRAGPAGACPQLVERSLADDASVAEEDEAIADARRVVQLMNGEEQRASGRRHPAQERTHLADLAEIESVERLVEQQHRLRGEQRERDEHALSLTLGERAGALECKWREVERACDLRDVASRGTLQRGREVEYPRDALVGPGEDAVRHVEERVAPLGWRERPSAARDASAVGGEQAGETLEERRLARAVWSDETEHLAGANGEARAAQRPCRAESL